jgi:hypothetical protein
MNPLPTAAGILILLILIFVGQRLDPSSPETGGAIGAAMGAVFFMALAFGWIKPPR